MLDELEKEQKVVCTILKNAVEKNRYSHAYLFETNGYKDADKMALAFAKYLLCPNHYTNNKKCVNCTQCNLIDQNLFSEIKIIEPDGLWIKKEQLDSLQKEFTQTAIQSLFRIYIIHHAEKMNTATANSILKFLEEPEPNIIAILITDNSYQLLSTIVSRCQIISFKKNVESKKTMLEKIVEYTYIPNSVDKSSLDKYVTTIANFVEQFEDKGENILLTIQSLWHNIIDDREKNLMAFELLLLFYKDVLNVKIERTIEIYNDFEKLLEKISSRNTIEKIIQKMKKINIAKEKIKLNVNQNLLMDEFILEMRSVT